MRVRVLKWIGLGLLIGLGVWGLWPAKRPAATATKDSPAAVASAAAAARPAPEATPEESTVSEATAGNFLTAEKSNEILPPPTNHLAYRLANTTKPVNQLLRDDHAVLLENALIDTTKPLGFSIPERLRAVGDPGSYIVQSRGPVDDAFRAMLAEAGVTLVSYIPNNAWLVRASADVAGRLAAHPETQAVLPWEPIYKPKDELLVHAMLDKPLPPGAVLNLLVFADARAEVMAQLQALAVFTVDETSSPFGTVVTVQPGADWLALARLPGVQIVERAYPRQSANDLTRVRLGVAATPVATNNYLGLTGAGVLVSINDSGVDGTHPDLVGRLAALSPASLIDFNGHGTFVAGTIAGDGTQSITVTNARGSFNPGTNGQYRGMAPRANLFVQTIGSGLGSTPDRTLQENAARTNVFISNNSWNYIGNSAYSLAAASYDAAVRDSLSGETGSQPLLYVFSAGNSGGGGDGGLSGRPGSVLSPATAKNVISVGAIELARDITNIVTKISGSGTNQTTNTSTPWKELTSSGNQVAAFSSRGNVGIGVEGDTGRFKPDVVAPGTFQISTRTQSPWDERAYYNPTNRNYTTLRNQVVGTNALRNYTIFLPENTVGFNITLYGNDDSPVPFPDLPIYVRRDGTPTAQVNDLRRTNVVAVPPDLGGVGAAVGQNWFYSVGNRTAEPVSFNILTEVITTNDLGDYYTVLSNLNNSITGTNQAGPHYYRYESGTSMAAAGVSGTLALMQQFFEQGLRATNSPALMKALLINGARTVGNLYDFQVRSTINYQGWGLVKLNNSLPPDITNAFKLNPQDSGSIKLLEQSPTNALATGQRQTWYFKLDEAGQTLPVRLTLAWTDPAGNPAAGVKLVNDLDLVVTNLDTGDIYLGNDIPSGTTFNSSWDTNEPPNFDSVNNVENVYLRAPECEDCTNGFAVTVLARRVNVNAVTAHQSGVVQDFALVLSSGNGEATNSITLTSRTGLVGTAPPEVIAVTNSISIPSDFSSSSLVNQRIGAHPSFLGNTNIITLSTNAGGLTNGFTLGITNQWKFYVLSNSTTFTNASFLVSQQTDLATPRRGVFSTAVGESTRRYADIDMYVSRDSGLTNLVPAVLAAASKSQSRNDLSGDELVIYADSYQGDTYYIGVKSEDQQAAQFEFWALFSLLPLGAEDADGFVRGYPMLGYEIPDGTPALPGGTRFVAIPRASVSGGAETVRRVMITNNVIHEKYGDVIATVDHNSRAVVFDNHRSPENPPYLDPPGPYQFLYDDSGEGDNLNAIPPDGPGTFETFMGEQPGGAWYFTYSDDALSQTGRVVDVRIKLDRQRDDNGAVTNTVAANSWQYYTRNVPVEATNLTVCISNITSGTAGPLQLYIRKDRRPTATIYDHALTINPPGDCLTVDKSSLPPLTSGRYFIGIFNPNPTAQTYVYTATLLLGPTPASTLFNGTGNTPILDDAANNYSITITNDARIAQVNVGVVIDHPRVSDLAVTLISPRGTRVLLAENRGGTDPNGFGSSLVVSNFVPVSASGGPAAQTNFIDTGSIFGSVTIDYNFFQAPDQMAVYYEGLLLTNTGVISGSGRFSLNYGPGASTLVEIRMNEVPNTNSTTLWNYTVSSISSANSYLVFTENTNLTTTPIKFAVPPFSGTGGTNYLISNFELPTVAQDYFGPTAGTPDGWSVAMSDRVTVITNTAYNNVQSLALRSGQISRTLPTVPGRSYRLGYAYRQTTGFDGIVGWWPGDNNPIDKVGFNNAVLLNGATYTNGRVSRAFFLDGVNDRITAPAVPALDFGPGQDFAIEGWIQAFPSVTDFNVMVILDKRSAPTSSTGLGISFYLSNGRLSLQMCDGVVPNTTWNAWSAGPNIQDGQYHHVAASVQRSSTTGGKLFVDGQLVLTFDPTVEPGSLVTTAPLRIGNHDTASLNCYFKGSIDEITIFKRTLSATEVQDIFAAGAAGKCGMVTPPAVCGPPLGAQISIPGLVTNSFLGTTNWQLGGLIFNATSTNTVVNLAPINSNASSGVLVDYFTLTETASPRYVLPEESLKVLEGENAFGVWQLEILDTRTGATNNVSLLDWQLQFIFQTNTALPFNLTSGVINTRTIPPGQTYYFVVDVPLWARFATNTLLAATAPLNIYFNQAILPTGTNLAPPDYTLFAGVTSGSRTLTTNLPAALPPNGTPLLVPGQRYYLALQNPNGVPVTFSYVVEFDLATFPDAISLTNGVPYCAFNPGPGVSLDYYRYTVSSNAVRAQFEINNPSGDMTLLLRRDLPPTFSVLDYFSANVFTNDEVITVFNFSQPVPLSPGNWYMAAVNISGGPVTYCVKATEWPVYGTNIVITNVFVGSNSFCLTWTSLPGVHYLVEGLTDLSSTNWGTVSPTVTAAGYSTTYCVPLPSPFHFFRVREGISLSPYYPPPYIFDIRRVFQGIRLTWSGPTNLQYQVQWSPTLVPTNWVTFTNPPVVTSASGVFLFLDNGSETGGFGATRFYRLLQLP